MFLQISQKMSIQTVAPVFWAKCITSAPSDLVPLLPSSRRPFFHSLMKNPGVILERNITLGSGNCAKLILSTARSCLNFVALVLQATGKVEDF